MRNSTFVYLILSFLFISCSYKQDQILFEQKNAAPDSVLQKSHANVDAYRIRAQDVLQIKNIQDSKNLVDLKAGTTAAASNSNAPGAQQGETYQVEDDGTIALTGIGRVQIAGLTRIEARKYIEDLYNKKFLNNAIFDVRIINLKVTILGEVKAQGNYVLIKDKTNLVELIGEAGGLTDKANEKNIKIVRGDEANPVTTIIDLSNIKSLSDPRIILRNNDIIYIAQNKGAIKAGKVQGFSVILQPALIVINTALIIFTLARQ